MLAGLYKLVNPSIPDGRTWTKLGEHGEHGKDGKHQPADLKYSIYDSKHSVTQSTLFVKQMIQNNLRRLQLKNYNIRTWRSNMILG